MTFEQFKKASKKQLKEYGKTLPMGRTEDADGNETSYRDGNGLGGERKFKNGNETSYRSCYGSGSETNYEDGIETSYRDSYGDYKINGRLVSKKEYEEFMKGEE